MLVGVGNSGLLDVVNGIGADFRNVKKRHINEKETLYKGTLILFQIRTSGDEVTQTTTFKGLYINIFNGMCCISAPNERRKRQVDDNDVYITKYDVSISNDASTFGTSMTVTVFDSSCQNVSDPDAGVVLEVHVLHSAFVLQIGTLGIITSQNSRIVRCAPITIRLIEPLRLNTR